MIERSIDIDFPIEHGHFRLYAYKNKLNESADLALVKGDVRGKDVLVRIHSECMTGDVLGSKRCDCREQLDTALNMIERAGTGILVYVRQEGRGIGLLNKLHAYKLQEEGMDTVEANEKLGFEADARDYGTASHILKDLGVKGVVLLTNNPKKEKEISEHGIRVLKCISLETMPNRHNVRYLETKKEKMGHRLDVRDKLMFF